MTSIVIFLFFKPFGYLLRILGRGSSLPGYLLLRLKPNVLGQFKLNHLVIITGTNGKTSTTNLIAQFGRQLGVSICSNLKGANQLSGIVTTLLMGSNFKLQICSDMTVLEVDELSLPKVFEFLNPQAVVILNFSRDQLDRIGEIEEVAVRIKSKLSSETRLILNGNDPLLVGFFQDHKNKLFFSLESEEFFVRPVRCAIDVLQCPVCGKNLEYSQVLHAQLGRYRCGCGFRNPESFVAGSLNAFGVMTIEGERFDLPNANRYFAFALLAGVSVFKDFGITGQKFNTGGDLHFPPGRMEKKTIKGQNVYVNLAKNPSGLTFCLNCFLPFSTEKSVVLVFFLNDRFEDGRDISWIYDVHFEDLVGENISKVVCLGTRAADLALRFEIAGFRQEQIVLQKEIVESLQSLISPNGEDIFIFSSYSGIRELSKEISRWG